jgi:septal ring factor EnvC (AmiA/AmiB activator)
LSTSGIISASRDERAGLQDRLKDLQRQKSLIDARDAMFEKEHKEARRKVDKQKRGLEKIVSELSNKRVQILLD